MHNIGAQVCFSQLEHMIHGRRVATCKPGKPGLTSFSETLGTFLHPISFILENEGTGQTKWSLGLTGKKLAGYAPAWYVCFFKIAWPFGVQLLSKPPGAPHTNFNDGGVWQRFIFYTQKNHNFRICLPKISLLLLAYPKKSLSYFFATQKITFLNEKKWESEAI